MFSMAALKKVDVRAMYTSFCSAAAIVIMNSILLFLWVVYHFYTKSPVHSMVLVSTLLALTAISYNRTAFSDPGTAKSEEWKAWAAGAAELGPSEAEKTSRRGQWAVGQATKCKKCNILRPERAHHCSRCRTCVLRMDHHCPIIGNCIGWKNHKYFALTTFWGFWATFAGAATGREPDFMDVAAVIRDGPYNHLGLDMAHVRLYTFALILCVSLMIFCFGLFVQDVVMGVLNTNRIEMWYRGANPYRLPNMLDNIRLTFGSLSWRLLLPLEPDRPAACDGTRFPLGGKGAAYGSVDQPYMAGWLHVE